LPDRTTFCADEITALLPKHLQGREAAMTNAIVLSLGMSIAVFQANGHYRQKILFVNTPHVKNFNLSKFADTRTLGINENKA
jgi:hypothetical protein